MISQPFSLLLAIATLTSIPTTQAALQARPVSEFPSDPFSSPKFQVSFLNELPISKSEARIWLSHKGLERENDASKGKEKDDDDGRTKTSSFEEKMWNVKDLRIPSDSRSDLTAKSANGKSEQESSISIPEIDPATTSIIESYFSASHPPHSIIHALYNTPSTEDQDPSSTSTIDETYSSLFQWYDLRNQYLTELDPSLVPPKQTYLETLVSNGNTSDLIPNFKLLHLPGLISDLISPPPSPPPSPKVSSSANDAISRLEDKMRQIHFKNHNNNPSQMKKGINDYLCMIPSKSTLEMERIKNIERDVLVEKRLEEDEENENEMEKNKEMVDPWDSLRHLDGSCLYYRQGWFTYTYVTNLPLVSSLSFATPTTTLC